MSMSMAATYSFLSKALHNSSVMAKKTETMAKRQEPGARMQVMENHQ